MNEKIKKNMSFELKRLRDSKNLTIEEVADATGYSSMMISRYENNQAKFIENLIGLLDFYGVTPDIFFKNVYTYTYDN